MERPGPKFNVDYDSIDCGHSEKLLYLDVVRCQAARPCSFQACWTVNINPRQTAQQAAKLPRMWQSCAFAEGSQTSTQTDNCLKATRLLAKKTSWFHMCKSDGDLINYHLYTETMVSHPWPYWFVCVWLYCPVKTQKLDLFTNCYDPVLQLVRSDYFDCLNMLNDQVFLSLTTFNGLKLWMLKGPWNIISQNELATIQDQLEMVTNMVNGKLFEFI